MMNDDYYDPYQEETVPPIGRWLFFGLLLILGPIGVIGATMLIPPELIFIYMFFYTPMVVFGLYATYRWAQGRSIAPTDVSDDDRILESMKKHALPVQKTPDSEIYRCPNCGNQFNFVNAMPIDVDIIKCPFCDTRLHLTE
jgi:DNA-directed RNA polymerase subunit RPC12/RpoP